MIGQARLKPMPLPHVWKLRGRWGRGAAAGGGDQRLRGLLRPVGTCCGPLKEDNEPICFAELCLAALLPGCLAGFTGMCHILGSEAPRAVAACGKSCGPLKQIMGGFALLSFALLPCCFGALLPCWISEDLLDSGIRSSAGCCGLWQRAVRP